MRKAARFGRVCGLEIPSALMEMESCPANGRAACWSVAPEAVRPRLCFFTQVENLAPDGLFFA